LSADDLGWSVLGFRRGWEGVMAIDPADPASIAAHTLPLDREAVRGIDRVGGTMLHTSRSEPATTAAATAPLTSCGCSNVLGSMRW
jgi:6-phosphofructokinase 1